MVKSNKKENSHQRRGRSNQRTIFEMIEKVTVWRKLYNGVIIRDPKGMKKVIKMTMTEAAKKVGVN